MAAQLDSDSESSRQVKNQVQEPASTEPAHEYDPSKEVLRKAKSATWEYNKTHSKK